MPTVKQWILWICINDKASGEIISDNIKRRHNNLKKLITSLACCTVLSMSLLGVGYASNASGTAGMGGTTQGTTGTYGTGNYPTNRDGNLLNRAEDAVNRGVGTMERGVNRMTNTGTTRTPVNDTIMTDKYRSYNNGTTSPISNDRVTGRYRATSTTTGTTTNNNGSNWGWLGLVGLLGLAGMRSRRESGERR